ncbi:MAG: hypothetical protein LUC90_06820 [Lachnospiraceae bacterium]|nr:hypothetical protein [Lachnospiraceae bacterium]
MSDIVRRFFTSLKHHRILKITVMIETLLFLLLFANCFRSRCDYTFGVGDMSMSGEYVVETTDEDGAAVYQAQSEGEVDGAVILSTDNLKFYPGAYNIRVSYRSQVSYMEESSFSCGVSYLNLESGSNSVYYTFPSLLLRDGLDSVEQRVQITSPWTISDLQLTVTFYGYGTVEISSIEVREIVAYRYVCLIGALLLFVFLDLFCFLVFIDREFSYGKELGVLTLICGAAALPFMADWTYWGDDLWFHIDRIMLLAKELSQGNFFPAIFSAALNGYGYAVPLFYGQVFLYLPAVLYNCGFGITFAYNLYVCMISTATCLIMYYCSLKIFHKSNTALLSSALYTFSAVRLTNVFVRGALGEYTAQTFFPLIFLGFYYVYMAPKGEKATFRKYWPIVAGLTAVFSCHTLSMEMCAMLIGLLCLILVKRTLEPQRLWGLVKAALLTLFINLAPLTVMLDSMSMDMYIGHQMGGLIQSSGAYPVQIFNSIVNGYQEGSVTGSASAEMSFSIGFSITLGLLLFLFYLARQKNQESPDTKSRNFAALCWGLSLFTIFLSSVYMFYDYLDFLPDAVYNLLVAYQFPWRWLSFAVLFGTFCTAAVVNTGELDDLFKGVSVTVVLVIALVINTGQIYSDQLRTSYLVSADNNLYSYSLYIAGENMLWGSDANQVIYRELLYDGTQLTVNGDYLYEDGGWILSDVENISDTAATVDIPLFNYDNYVAYDTETGEAIAITNGRNNRIRLNIPAGYSGTIEVKYQIPLLWKIAAALSVITDLLVIGCVLLRKRGKLPDADVPRPMKNCSADR